MSRRRGYKDEKKGAPEWMATYGDMMTLLLCFFILLYSFSVIDVEKFKLLQISLQDALGVLPGGRTLESGSLIMGGEPQEGISRYREEEKFREIKERLETALEQENLRDAVFITIDERGLLIRFLDTVLFDTGRVELKPQARQILDIVGDILSSFENRPIRVEGHTDNIPINTLQFPSNWELSVSRSTNVIRYLIQQHDFPPDKMSAAGYGEYKPVASNDTAEERKLNRRVDIVVLRSHIALQEPR